ncbi:MULTISPECIES: hydroxyisourate hydrolase [Bacillus]|uniref:5-hydroxyisourate hydrolase n=2 Tax=Bacillus TaxID=1386 RepID=A0A0M4FKH9_9BACI|nr:MULTISPECIES: hydroxyisourate hydrolase [Bacillus]ALC82267.1 5-hydroxyisourate hydrolase [Bacillus gobiensis]MBP1081121.1 5-hydroxyisourate hydrolase [Bacillus capparidis]MED1095806.1 hydroxyisourate hydrolase [Bacillus capparidis]
MGQLTTHILDLTHGIPASRVKIELYSIEQSNRSLLANSITNKDGRVDKPLLSEEKMVSGEYELLFYIGDYFKEKETPLPDPPFLNVVSVRFGIADPGSHYHVPLLVSPWGYQVYRGS